MIVNVVINMHFLLPISSAVQDSRSRFWRYRSQKVGVNKFHPQLCLKYSC